MIVDRKNQGGKTKVIFENSIFSHEGFCLLVKLTLEYA